MPSVIAFLMSEDPLEEHVQTYVSAQSDNQWTPSASAQERLLGSERLEAGLQKAPVSRHHNVST